MLSTKKLRRIRRKKRELVARSDLLREECGEMWAAVGRRSAGLERALLPRWTLPPAAAAVLKTGLLCLKARYLGRKPYLEPLFVAADAAIDLTQSGSQAETEEAPPRYYAVPRE